MLTPCTAEQKPYAIGSVGTMGFYAGSVGDTPIDACMQHVAVQGGGTYSFLGATQFECRWTASVTVFPIRQVCDATPQFTVEKIADMSALWSLFLLAAIVILCIRKLFNVFDRAPHGEN